MMTTEIPLWLAALGAIVGGPGSGAVGAWIMLRVQQRKAEAEADAIAAGAEEAQRMVEAHVASEDATAVQDVVSAMEVLAKRVTQLEKELMQEREERIAERAELKRKIEECEERSRAASR